jgi:hypothetical protein
MHGTQKNMNTVNTARIYINFKYYTTDINVDISSNNWVRDFPAASRWCKKADLMTAGSGEANRDVPQGLLRQGKGPTSSTAILKDQVKA